jgi:hypothetical protein
MQINESDDVRLNQLYINFKKCRLNQLYIVKNADVLKKIRRRPLEPTVIQSDVKDTGLNRPDAAIIYFQRGSQRRDR